jgi:CO dehydrogenase/acetyl-CoA synthase beta subunit
MKKLISFEDFKSSKSIKEGVDEIIPEGLPDEPTYTDTDSKIEKVKEFISEADDDVLEEIVNQLRDTLLEMEQDGFVDSDTTDELDKKYDGDWNAWALDVIDLPDFPEEGLNNVLAIQEDSTSDTGGENDASEDSYEENSDEEDEDDLPDLMV